MIKYTRNQITLENESIDVYNGVDSRYWIIPKEIYGKWKLPPGKNRHAIRSKIPLSISQLIKNYIKGE